MAAEAAVEAILAVVQAQLSQAPPVVRVVESARTAAILAAVEAVRSVAPAACDAEAGRGVSSESS